MGHTLQACLSMPHFLAQVMQQRVALSADTPIVIANGTTDRAIIIDVSPHAREHGIETGMLVWAARRQCRWLHAIADDADATAAAIERIETVLVRHSHVVTNDRPGRWTFSLAALGSAYGQATAIAEGLLDDVWHTTGFHGGIGLAAQPGIAKIAAALTANQGGSVVVLPGTEAAFLAPLTVTVLPGIGAKTQVALTRLGVTTIGHLANVSSRDAHAGMWHTRTAIDPCRSWSAAVRNECD